MQCDFHCPDCFWWLVVVSSLCGTIFFTSLLRHRSLFHFHPTLHTQCNTGGDEAMLDGPQESCVCVCNLWSHKVPVGLFLLIFQQGGTGGP